MYETMVLHSEALLSVPFGEGSVMALLLCYAAGAASVTLSNQMRDQGDYFSFCTTSEE